VTQLVAIGAQDVHLVGSPEVSFFRSTYKRHTNFTQVVDRQIIQGNPAANGMSTVRFERKGDLLSYVYLTKKDASGVSTTFDVNDIAKVEFLIGGQVIDDQDYRFSRFIASRLLVSNENKSTVSGLNPASEDYFYPLHFWFCENWQSAIPLVALQYHDIEIRITWGSGVVAGERFELWSNFILLDADERQKMTQEPINMLILQTQKAVPSNGKIQELNFNHPIKFLASNVNLVSSPTTNTLLLQINGVDIGEPRTYTPHFNIASLYFHASTFPGVTGSSNLYGQSFLYPFCLDTNRLQPTGTLNFSRLDSARLVSTANFNQTDGYVYAVNYNILRIQNGMGGVMYAN
jgi:hypothetical protein